MLCLAGPNSGCMTHLLGDAIFSSHFFSSTRSSKFTRLPYSSFFRLYRSVALRRSLLFMSTCPSALSTYLSVCIYLYLFMGVSWRSLLRRVMESIFHTIFHFSLTHFFFLTLILSCSSRQVSLLLLLHGMREG